MPQASVKAEVLRSAWTLSEQIEESRGKLHLKERDANALYEDAEVHKLNFEKLITRLRKENKEKRIDLSRSINWSENVIRSVFRNRKQELLSMQNCTSTKAISVMDQKVCEASKRLNALQHKRQQCIKRLAEMETERERILKISTIDITEEKEQEIRQIENEIDKADIKFSAAANITRRYEEIFEKMQEECGIYPMKLDLLEEAYRETSKEMEELKEMREKAVHAGEEARRDLHSMEREMYQTKRARDQQLNEMRKEVEKRKEVADKTEKRPRITVTNETGDSKIARQQQRKTERQEKMLTLENAFEIIKRNIHVSDINDVIVRFSNQGSTHQKLHNEKKEKLIKRAKLQEELNKLTQIVKDLKFNSHQQMLKGRKMINDLFTFLDGEEKRRDTALENWTQNEKLLSDVHYGIATLLGKLKDVKLKSPAHNFAPGEPLGDLDQCVRKLRLLFTELGFKKYVPPVINKIENQKFYQYLETLVPQENVRVRMILDDLSEADEIYFDHDQDNEGFTTREDIKHQGQEILNSLVKPKKKKGRKRNP
ncbi:hypothetical protein CHS0354_008099 [Potamilus streckersoni]|uniref:Uncharacterized protein n=1 Tax=Potamilus streckersoni TaxID=2493646 RepID=A0AAE0W4P7_9BIVA|nr:hypothetical protein CHS0354_008099 [Potamilus streckersoni]